jgi:hypothetical protein
MAAAVAVGVGVAVAVDVVVVGKGEGERERLRAAAVVEAGARWGLSLAVVLVLVLLRGLSGAGEEVPLRAARGGGEIKVLLGLVVALPVLVPVLTLRVLVGEVRVGRGGERGPFVLPTLDPAPWGGRRLAGGVISFRGMP